MLQFLNPEGVPAPASRYSQMVSAPADFRWLHVSGQIGCDGKQKIAAGFEAQAELAWANVLACLRADGMDKGDLVKVNVFLTRAADVPASRIARDRMLAGATPASTLLVVGALAHPDLLIEVEAIAAKAP